MGMSDNQRSKGVLPDKMWQTLTKAHAGKVQVDLLGSRRSCK